MRSAEVRVAPEKKAASCGDESSVNYLFLPFKTINLVFKVLFAVKKEVVILFFKKKELQVRRINNEAAYNCS